MSDEYEDATWVYAGQRETTGGKILHKWYDVECLSTIDQRTGNGEFYFGGRNGGAAVLGGIYTLKVATTNDGISALFGTLEYTGKIYDELRPAWVIKHNAAKSVRTRKVAENKTENIQEDLSDFTLGEIAEVGFDMTASQRRALMARVMQFIERGYEQ